VSTCRRMAALALAGVCGAFAWAAMAGPPRLDPLRESDLADGCGCSFHVPPRAGAKGRTILQWEIDSRATMRLDGRVRKLDVVGVQEASTPERAARIGDKAVFELKGADVDVRADCVVTRVCRPDDEACENVAYRARLKVRTAGGERVVDAWASCGC